MNELENHEEMWELIATYRPCDIQYAKERVFNEWECEPPACLCYYCELYMVIKTPCIDCPFFKKFGPRRHAACKHINSPYAKLCNGGANLEQAEWTKLCLEIARMHK